MSSLIGKTIQLSIFGESHGEMIGCTLHDLPAGEEIDLEAIKLQMTRRAPGNDETATTRKEPDLPRIVSGFYNGKTTGTPLTAIIENQNTKSEDYTAQISIPRPSHADYTGYIKYNGANDIRGGGHFSGRLTAPIVFAGALCRQILKRFGITIGAHIYSIANVSDAPFDSINVSDTLLEELSKQSFSLIDKTKETAMREVITKAKADGDSVGGIIELAVTGLPIGIGSPIFDGVENVLAKAIFGIPAVKGLEFGSGFALSTMKGSEANDSLSYTEDGKIAHLSNHNGGIIGGITTGAPLILRVAIKPTPSISKPQPSIDITKKSNTTTVIKGRHDPCIVPRAVSVLESTVAFVLLDLLKSESYDLKG